MYGEQPAPRLYFGAAPMVLILEKIYESFFWGGVGMMLYLPIGAFLNIFFFARGLWTTTKLIWSADWWLEEHEEWHVLSSLFFFFCGVCVAVGVVAFQ